MSNQFNLIIGSTFAIFLIGAIFWAGATYQRVSSIEGHLGSIDSQLSVISNNQSEVSGLRDRVVENQKRLEKLEDLVQKLK